MKRIAWGCLLVLALSSVASADSKAWTAAKKALPAGIQNIVSLNVAALHDTKLFQTLWPLILEKDHDISDAFGAMKDACTFDPIKHVDSLVVAAVDDSDDSAVFVLALNMIEGDVEKCFAKSLKAHGQDVVIGKDGAFVTYKVGDTTAYARWLDKNTMVIAKRKDAKEFLTKMTAGGIAKDASLGGVKTDAPLWVLLVKPGNVDPLGVKPSRAYIAGDLKSGNITANAHLVLDGAEQATEAAKKAQMMLDAAKLSGQVPPQLDWVVKSIVINAVGSELVLTAAGTEQNVVDLIKQAAQ